MNLVICSLPLEEYGPLVSYVNDNSSKLKQSGILINCPAKEIVETFSIPETELQQFLVFSTETSISTPISPTLRTVMFQERLNNMLIPWYNNLSAVVKYKLAIIVLPIHTPTGVVPALLTGLKQAKSPRHITFLQVYRNTNDPFRGTDFAQLQTLRIPNVGVEFIVNPGPPEEIINLIQTTYQ